MFCDRIFTLTEKKINKPFFFSIPLIPETDSKNSKTIVQLISCSFLSAVSENKSVFGYPVLDHEFDFDSLLSFLS